MLGYPETMQALSIELEDDIVDALEAERELFGFESRQAYVRWIVEHRGSIEAGQGPDPGRRRDRLLADHSERIARLEERVTTLSRALEESEADSDADGSDRARAGAEPAGAVDERDADEQPPERDATPASDRDRRADGPTASREPVLEVRGSPRTVRQGPDARRRSATGAESESESDDAAANEDDDSSTATRSGDDEETRGEDERPTRGADGNRNRNRDSSSSETADTESAASSGAITPERVARIREDPVHEDAGVLGNVEAERLDELSRRAVATTRKRLNRDVQTGLEYTSSTGLAGDGVRPGEDVTDLDALSIPGRSEKTVEKRRHAVGRALAYLRDEGRARRSDFVDALYAECPAEYDTTDGWWRCIKTGLKQVDAVEGGEGTRVWRYRG